MDQIVLDTDVCSYFFKRDSRAARYRPHLDGRTVCVAFQTVAEMHQGAELNNWGVRRRQELDAWLGSFVVLPSDDEMARAWARVRATRQRLGRTISPQDAWIAACALRYAIPLATNNAKDYVDIPGLILITEG